MQRLDSFNLLDWIDAETKHLDVVASWENLCSTYENLRFSDVISDANRLEEFKWIIKEMNKFLTRARSALLKQTEPDQMMYSLMEMYKTPSQVKIVDRKSVTYQKLRQIWIDQMITNLKVYMLDLVETEE